MQTSIENLTHMREHLIALIYIIY